MALSTASREAIWTLNFAEHLRFETAGSMKLLSDDETSLQMSQEADLTEASKHIARYFQFLHEKVD